MKRYIVEYKFDTFYMQSVNSYILERKRESLVLIVQASLFFFYCSLFCSPTFADYMFDKFPHVLDITRYLCYTICMEKVTDLKQNTERFKDCITAPTGKM